MIYHLNIRHGDRHVVDEEGIDLPDIAAARLEAIIAAREIMAEAMLRGDDVSDSLFEIIEEDNGVIAEVPFASVVVRLH